MLARLAGADGWVWRDPDAPIRYCNLADLLDRARRTTNPNAVAKKGRQAHDVNRDLHELTPAQLADVERLGALIVRHTIGADGDPTRVSSASFVWDPTLNGGHGGWALQTYVEQWAEAEHRAKYEARQQGGAPRRRGRPRSPARPSSTTAAPSTTCAT